MNEKKTPKQSTNKQIARNTLMLYFRHILIMFVSLYTVRVVLSTLGVEDFGIYNVVGGVVALFSFFSSTMASASQRFFSFAIGEGNRTKLQNLFAVNWVIYGIIAVIVLILLETLGLWFVESKLALPEERVNTALWIYHFSILAFLCSILTTPFMSMIIAHEDMNVYAYVSIFEAFLKLGVVFLLVSLPGDKLQLYGVLVFLSTLLSSSLYVYISKKKYQECRFRFIWNKRIFKEVFSFTGWSIFGSISVVIRNQAVTILLNQMFNPAIVSTRAIATQIANNVNVFSNNFNTGLYPPIVKSYAAKENERMLNLIFNGSKITYCLMFFFTLPLLLEMPYVINLWLKNPPESVVLFARLALIDSLITAISLPLMTAVRATGRIKIYELTLGSILIISFFVSWGILRLGAEAYSVMIVAIVATILMLVLRLILLNRILNFPVFRYIKKVILPISIMSLISSVLSYIISYSLLESFVYFCISILSSLLIASICMYFMVFDKIERTKIKNIITSKISKINRK